MSLNLQPFQQLYSHLRVKDNKLFLALTRISNYVQRLANALNELQSASAPVYQVATGALSPVPAVYTDMPGLFCQLTKKGNWYISSVVAFSGNATIIGSAQIVVNDIVQGLPVSTSDAAGAWLHTIPVQAICLSLAGNEVVKVQVLSSASPGLAAHQNTSLVAVWISE